MSALTKKQLEDVVTGLNQRLDGLLSKITALESMPARLTHLEALLEAAALENANLRQSLEAKDTTINGKLLKMNSLEQYNRSWSIRINGLAVTSEEEKDSDLVKRKVYNNLLLPILQGAVKQGDLTDVPPVERVLEAATCCLRLETPRLSRSLPDFLSVTFAALYSATRRTTRPGRRPPRPTDPAVTSIRSLRTSQR